VRLVDVRLLNSNRDYGNLLGGKAMMCQSREWLCRSLLRGTGTPQLRMSIVKRSPTARGL
jgi:hypothetical protein